jgi:hypothetical protein
MCCLITTLFLIGPRLAILVWWLVNPARLNVAFGTFLWPLLGLVLLPWTTLMYIFIIPGGIVGFDWIWISLAFLTDLAGYTGSGYANRRRIPGLKSMKKMPAEEPILTTKEKETTTANKEKRLLQLRKLYVQHQDNLQKLREQEAIFGLGERPLRLLNQIEAEKKAVEEIQLEIERLTNNS